MTEREIEARLRNERISLPDGFEARQEAALRRVMAKREGVLPKRMAWLAAALVLMMSAAAIAAGGRGLAFFWRQASPEAKRVLFAALCRALGVPARLAPEDGAAEYWQNGVWKRTEGRDTRGTVVLICPAGEKWVCGVDYSLSALMPDGARLLWPSADGLTFSAAPGDYCLLTTNRLPNGDQRVLRLHFSLAAGERRTIRLERAHAALAEMLGSHAMEDFFSARTAGIRCGAHGPRRAADVARARAGADGAPAARASGRGPAGLAADAARSGCRFPAQ